MSRLRIGDFLVLHQHLDPWGLKQALADQKTAGQRLVSFLIARAQLDADDGALALAEQLGVPAALQRHLEKRDPAVVGLVPSDVARRHVVFPIARANDGSLVVAARDPTTALRIELERVTHLTVVLAVTPAIQVERAVLAAYGELEVGADELVALDGSSESTRADFAEFELGHALPAQKRRPSTVSDVVQAVAELSLDAGGRAAVAPEPPRRQESIELALAEIDRAPTRVVAEQHLMAYVGRCWKTALLFEVQGDVAIAAKEHNVEHRPVDSIILSLSTPSILQVAVETKAATKDRPLGLVQDRLTTLLGAVGGAAPIVLDGEVEAVIVVGRALETGRNTAAELARLAGALAAAYTRSP